MEKDGDFVLMGLCLALRSGPEENSFQSGGYLGSFCRAVTRGMIQAGSRAGVHLAIPVGAILDGF